MRKSFGCLMAGVCLAASGWALGGDWNQWHGPEGNGVSPGGPPLADSWPADGPPQLWMSEKLVGGPEGGYGSVSVAGGKAYIYVNQKENAPTERRELTDEALRQLGWFAQKLPAELSKAVEEARVSEERAKLVPKEVGPWIQNWLTNHLSEADRKTLGPQAADRLKRGTNAVPHDALDKLATIKGKEFPNQAELDKWYEANAITPEVKKTVDARIPKTCLKAYDIVCCLDRDGKTVWKHRTESRWYEHSRSSSPAVIGGKVFVPASSGYLYCLDAEKGEVIWKTGALRRPGYYKSAKAKVEAFAPAPAGSGFSGKVETVAVTYTYSVGDKPYKGQSIQELFPGPKDAKPKTEGYQSGKEITAWYDPDQPEKSMLEPIAPPPFVVGDHHSVVATANVAVLLAGQLTAFDTATGATLWTQPKVQARSFPVNTPVIWKSGERTFVLCNQCNDEKVASCVDLKSGEILWSVPGGGMSTVAAQGEYMVVQTDGKEVGLLCYKISPDKAEKVWNVVTQVIDSCASPVIYKGHAFAIANNRALCVELAGGKVCWDEKLTSSYGSPVLADGKIFANSGNVLVMFPATPEKFVQPIKSKIRMCDHTSPAVADGKLYLRVVADGKVPTRPVPGVACFDLTAGTAASGPAEGGLSKTENRNEDTK